MTDKQFNVMAFLVSILIVWWLWKHRRQDDMTVQPSDSPALPVNWTDPMNSVYAGNVPRLQPAPADNLSINIANQSAGLLSQTYIPLFGFVGMAQGAIYS